MAAEGARTSNMTASTTPDVPSATLPFLPNFSWAFVRMDPANVAAKFEVCSFTHSLRLHAKNIPVARNWDRGGT